MAGRSLLWRIALRLSATLVAAMVAGYGWMWWEFDTTRGILRHQALQDWAMAVAAGLKPGPDGRPTLSLSPQMRRAYAESQGEHGFSVRDATGRVLFAEGAPTEAPPAHVPDGVDGVLYLHDPDGPGPLNYFGIALKVPVGGRQVVVQVEHRAADYQVLMQSVADEFFDDGAWMSGPFLAVLLAVTILSIRASLAPVRKLSRLAEAIGPTATDIRLPETAVPSELLPLIRAVNRAFDRLQEGFRIQREFTADAAHELRTPLAVLGAHIDVLPNRADAVALRKDLDAVTRLVGQLLRVAQLDAMVLDTTQQADLNHVGEEVAAWLAPMAIRDGRDIEFRPAPRPALVRGNADAIFHALRNLTENALTHTPRGTAVSLAVEGDGTAISVRDRGPGVPADQRQRVFQRFARLSQRHVGAGLGLAIVRRTMEAHGGTVEVDDAEGGGAVFTLRFPPGA